MEPEINVPLDDDDDDDDKPKVPYNVVVDYIMQAKLRHA